MLGRKGPVVLGCERASKRFPYAPGRYFSSLRVPTLFVAGGTVAADSGSDSDSDSDCDSSPLRSSSQIDAANSASLATRTSASLASAFSSSCSSLARRRSSWYMGGRNGTAGTSASNRDLLLMGTIAPPQDRRPWLSKDPTHVGLLPVLCTFLLRARLRSKISRGPPFLLAPSRLPLLGRT